MTLLPMEYTNDDTKEFSMLYSLLIKLTNNALLADTFYHWLLNKTEIERSLYRYMFKNSYFSEFSNPYQTAPNEVKANYRELTERMANEFISSFSVESAYELLNCAYNEYGEGSATKKLECFISYWNKPARSLTGSRLKLVGDDEYSANKENNILFTVLIHQLIATITYSSDFPHYRSLYSYHLRRHSNNNRHFAVEYAYRLQLGLEPEALVPVRIYTSSNMGTGENLLYTILSSLNLVIKYSYEAVVESWFGRLFVSPEPTTTTAGNLDDMYDKIATELRSQYLKTQEDDVDKSIIEAASALTKAAKDEDTFVVQIGSLIFMKYKESDGSSHVFIRKLSRSELIIINENQEVLKKPQEVFTLLQINTPKTIKIMPSIDSHAENE